MRENVYWFFICQNITNPYKCGILILDLKNWGGIIWILKK